MDLKAALSERNDIRFKLSNERELHTTIRQGLHELHELYRADKKQFSPENIEFLQGLNVLADQLEQYIEGIDDCSRLRHKLLTLREDFRCMKVCLRVEKEIRGLEEKLPAIHELEETRKRGRFMKRKVELESNAEPCPREHAMEIRERSNGWFWGRTKYPRCHHT